MALKKIITESNGISTAYHKIKNIEVGIKKSDMGRKKEGYYFIKTQVESYVSEDLRRISASNAVIVRPYNFFIRSAEVDAKGIHEVVYAKLKTLELFEGADNC